MDTTDWIANSAVFVMWANIIVFNLAIMKLLQIVLRKTDMREALTEKHDVDASAKKDGQPPSSYSRLAGLVGAVVLGCFLWALGNVVLYKAFSDPTEVSGLIAGVGGFFLGGAALFAPYAFNQLGIAFKPPS